MKPGSPKHSRPFYAVLLVGLLLPPTTAVPEAAASGVSCHCFRDRSFDPQNPSAVDPYVLATTQNSLFAAVYGVSKKQVVRTKMTGTDGSQMWVAQAIAAHGEASVGELLAARSRAGTWVTALANIGVALPEDLAAGDPSDGALAAAVVDRVLASHLGAAPRELRLLRAGGASDEETIAAVYLGLRTQNDPVLLFRRVRGGETSWGDLLRGSGLEPEQIEEDIASRAR